MGGERVGTTSGLAPSRALCVLAGGCCSVGVDCGVYGGVVLLVVLLAMVTLVWVVSGVLAVLTLVALVVTSVVMGMSVV